MAPGVLFASVSTRLCSAVPAVGYRCSNSISSGVHLLLVFVVLVVFVAGRPCCFATVSEALRFVGGGAGFNEGVCGGGVDVAERISFFVTVVGVGSIVVSCGGDVGGLGLGVVLKGEVDACGSLDHVEFADRMLAAVSRGSMLRKDLCLLRLGACRRSLKKANSASSIVRSFARSLVVSCVGAVCVVCRVSVGGVVACGSPGPAEFAGRMLAAVSRGSMLREDLWLLRLGACRRSVENVLYQTFVKNLYILS